MRRETQNVLLILLGGALVKLAVTGDYLRYVKPAQQPWILGAGIVLILLAGVAILRDVRSGPDSSHVHQHSARPAWLLLAPVFAVLLVAPPALGADSVTRAADTAPAAATPSETQFSPLPPGDPVDMRVTDFVTRAGWDAGGTLNGRNVRLSGFIARKGPDVLLARMVIRCCAADSTPVLVRLDSASVSVPDDTWVEVVGQVVPKPPLKQVNYPPELIVAAIQPAAAPPDPYEY